MHSNVSKMSKRRGFRLAGTVGHCRPSGLLLLIALITAPGCGSSGESASKPDEGPPAKEIWEATYLGGSKVGYGHTTIRSETRDGREALRIEYYNRLAIQRFGETLVAETRFSSLDPAGSRLSRIQSRARARYESTSSIGAPLMDPPGRPLNEAHEEPGSRQASLRRCAFS